MMMKEYTSFTVDDIRAVRNEFEADYERRGLTMHEIALEIEREGYRVARKWGIKVDIPDWVDQIDDSD